MGGIFNGAPSEFFTLLSQGGKGNDLICETKRVEEQSDVLKKRAK